MDEQYGMADQLKDEITHQMKKRITGRIIRFVLANIAPIFLFVVIMLMVTGVMQGFSAIAGIGDSIFGEDSGLTEAEKAEILDSMELDDIIALVETDRIDASFYEAMMINRDEFLYLLNSVKEYNEAHIVRTIQIQTKHEYKEWVELGNGGVGEAAGSPDAGYYESKVDYEYKEIEIDSAEIETFDLDWQLVFAACASSVTDNVNQWGDIETVTGLKKFSYYGVNHALIDDVMDSLSMKYEYVYDLARSSKTKYSMDECQKMVHTPYQYGDPDTEAGRWTYYVPHSVLASAYSCYAVMYYQYAGNMLTDLVTASDIQRLDLTLEQISEKNTYETVGLTMELLPGGSEVKERLDRYKNAVDAEHPYYLITSIPLANYHIGSGLTLEDLPTSMDRIVTDFEDVPFEEIEYDGSTGSQIVRAAARKIGCEYSQANRWDENVYDCSSFVWRILGEVGINLWQYCGLDSTAAGICKGMIENGMIIDPSMIQPGDIVFYSYEINGRFRNVSHVTIYAGDGQMIHARGVKYGVVKSAYKTSSQVCVCRPYK